MAGIRGPDQAQTVDQIRMFEIANLGRIVVEVRIGMWGIEVDPEIRILEHAVRGRAREAPDQRGLRGIVIDLVDHRRVEAKQIAPEDDGEDDPRHKRGVCWLEAHYRGLKCLIWLAGVERLELPTPGFGDRCSTN